MTLWLLILVAGLLTFGTRLSLHFASPPAQGPGMVPALPAFRAHGGPLGNHLPPTHHPQFHPGNFLAQPAVVCRCHGHTGRLADQKCSADHPGWNGCIIDNSSFTGDILTSRGGRCPVIFVRQSRCRINSVQVPTNGFPRFSSPTVDFSPCPESNCVSSGSENTCSVILLMSVSQSPPGRSVRPTLSVKIRSPQNNSDLLVQ